MNKQTKQGISIVWHIIQQQKRENADTKWRTLNNIMLNERNQSQMITYYMLLFPEMFIIGISIEKESKLVVA